MQAIIKINAKNGNTEFAVHTLDELERATDALDKVGTDYAIEYRAG